AALHDEKLFSDDERVVRGRLGTARFDPARGLDGVLAKPGVDELRPGDPREVPRRHPNVGDRIEVRGSELEGAAHEVVEVAAGADAEEHHTDDAQDPRDDAPERGSSNFLMDPGFHSGTSKQEAVATRAAASRSGRKHLTAP